QESAPTYAAPLLTRMLERNDLAPGTVLGGYEITGELGRGGMATVYLAQDLKLHRQVALKVLRRQLAASLGSERFLREIAIAARLSHPHILPLHDSGEADGQLYYAMPYVAGESLRQKLVREGQLPVAEVIGIVSAVAGALSYAHQQGIIHRDIKPENILLTRNTSDGTPHPMVADFGIARAVDKAGGERLTETGIALGTPAYMSPEQASPDSRLDSRSDIYSLGCVAYEMLAGEPPFTGPSAQAIVARHAVDPVPPLRTVRSTVPEPVELAIERALAKVPADRFPTATEFAKALLRPEPKRVPRRAPSAGRLRLALGAAVAVLASGSILILLRDSPRPAVIDKAASMAVLPFFPAGRDTALTRLGRDLAVTVSTSLNDVGGIKTTDRLSVADATAGSHGLSAGDGAALARRLGATSFLRGRVERVGDQVRLNIGLFATGDVVPLSPGITVTADPDSIGALTDSVAWSVLRAIWQRGEPPSPSLSDITTHSLPALRNFLEGERELALEHWQEAGLAFQSAIAADSSFWLAHFRYALTQFWLERPVEPEVLGAISQHRNQFTEPERLLAEGFLALDTIDVRLKRLRVVTQRFPDYWPGWLLYADHLHHNGPSLGHDWSEAIQAFRRAVALNPKLAPAWTHMAWLAAGKDPALVSEAHSRLSELGYPPAGWPDERFQFQLDEAVSRAGGVLPDDMYDVADSVADYIVSPEGEGMAQLMALKLLQAGFPTAQLALNQRVLVAGRATPDLVTWFRGVNAWAWASRGAWDSALTIMMDVTAKHPGPYRGGKPVISLSSYALAVLGVWLGVTPNNTAEQRRPLAAKVVAELPDGEDKHDALGRLAWFDGLLGFAAGDRRAVRAAREAAARSGYQQKDLVDRSLWAFDQALAGNRTEAGRTLAQLEEECVTRIGCNHRTPNRAVQRLAAAQWLQETEELERAARLLRYQDEPNRGYDWLPRDALAGPTYLARARIEERRGNSALALEYYEQFLRRYDSPVAALRPLIDEARRARARLPGSENQRS
ncbi:MAG TPA: serine/threonine-protein kinase, partial [Gemmatimonadales bacterium]|nr:serine/threonine-protein kinase [Gemmatimonadales bacterium]